MNKKYKTFNIIILSSLIIFQIILHSTLVPPTFNNGQKSMEFTDIHASRQNTILTQWINNPTFESPIEPGWFWKNGTEGDNSDMEAATTPGQADFLVLGEEQTFTLVSGVVNSSTSPGWKQIRNGDFQYPTTAEINSEGCKVYHY